MTTVALKTGTRLRDMRAATRQRSRGPHHSVLASFGILVVSAILGTPLAAADTSEPITSIDNDYLRDMAQEGVTAADSRDMIDEGQWVCTSLIHGDTARDVDAQIKVKNPRMTQVQVNALIGFAVSEYCEGEHFNLGG